MQREMKGFKNSSLNDDFTLATPAPLEVVFQRIAAGLPGSDAPWVENTVKSLLGGNSKEVKP